MSTPLDVLVIEGGRGSGAAVARALGAAGHRAHRCTSTGGDAPCRGVVDICDCPLDHGTDVALVVAGDADDRRTGVPALQSASCARRAGVPVVELGDDPELATFAPYLAARLDAGTDVVDAVEQAAAAAFAELARAVLVMAAPLMRDLGIDLHAVDCTIDRQGDQLRVRLDLPEDADEATRQALAVRALAALGGVRRHHSSVSIGVHGPRPPVAVPAG
jgi:hypothetical protein